MSGDEERRRWEATAKAAATEAGDIAKNSTNSDKVFAAIRALGEQNTEYAAKELGDIARDSTNSDKVVAALSALGKMGRKRC